MCVITNYVEQITVNINKKKEIMSITKKYNVGPVLASIAIAHDHSSLFDKCVGHRLYRM